MMNDTDSTFQDLHEDILSSKSSQTISSELKTLESEDENNSSLGVGSGVGGAKNKDQDAAVTAVEEKTPSTTPVPVPAPAPTRSEKADQDEAIVKDPIEQQQEEPETKIMIAIIEKKNAKDANQAMALAAENTVGAIMVAQQAASSSFRVVVEQRNKDETIKTADRSRSSSIPTKYSSSLDHAVVAEKEDRQHGHHQQQRSSIATAPRVVVVGAFAIGGGGQEVEEHRPNSKGDESSAVGMTPTMTQPTPVATSSKTNYTPSLSTISGTMSSNVSSTTIQQHEQQQAENLESSSTDNLTRVQEERGILVNNIDDLVVDEDANSHDDTMHTTTTIDIITMLPTVTVSAWEVHIDEESAPGQAFSIVQAEKSAEDHLRRWNRRLVGIVVLLSLIVGAVLVGVLVSKDGGVQSSSNDDDGNTAPGNNNTNNNNASVFTSTSNTDMSSAPTASPWFSTTTRPTFAPVAWSRRGQPLSGNSTKEEFGKSISLSSADGTVIAVGAWGYQQSTGRVEIFEYDNEAWIPLGMPLVGQAEGNQLGISIDLSADGTMLVTGANQYNFGETRNRTGFVRVFRYYQDEDEGNAQWTQVGLKIPGTAEHEQFGWKVAMSSNGNIVAASASRHGGRTGYVRVFWLDSNHNNTEEWQPMGRTLKGVALGDQFGTSLALSSDGMTVAGGADENDDAGLNAGHVRVFRFVHHDDDVNDGDWEQLGQTLEALAANDDFGYAISLSDDGRILAVGAWQHEETLGYVQVFAFDDDSNEWHQLGSTIFGEYAGSQFGVSIELSSDGKVLVVGANEYNFGQQNKPGAAYIYRFDGLDWLRTGPELVGDASDDRFGWDVSITGDGSAVAISAYRNDATFDRAGQVQILEMIHST